MTDAAGVHSSAWPMIRVWCDGTRSDPHHPHRLRRGDFVRAAGDDRWTRRDQSDPTRPQRALRDATILGADNKPTPVQSGAGLAVVTAGGRDDNDKRWATYDIKCGRCSAPYSRQGEGLQADLDWAWDAAVVDGPADLPTRKGNVVTVLLRTLRRLNA